VAQTIVVLPLLVAGWLVGALLNYLADVLLQTRRLTQVKCTACERPRSLADVLLVRPCAGCGVRRPARHGIVQALSMAVTVAIWYLPPDRLNFWWTLPLFAYLGLVMIMDLEHRVILHPVSIFGAIFGAVLGVWMNGISLGEPLEGLKVTALGGLGGFGIMLGLYLLGEGFSRVMARLRGQPIDEVALGFGDVNLSGVLGLMLGWPKAWILILAAVLLGGVVSGIYLLFTVLTRRYQAFTAIPYAPFLIVAAVVFFYMA
jgi:leader peptidase (prepilin peptidase)/N-methyltransferase